MIVWVIEEWGADQNWVIGVASSKAKAITLTEQLSGTALTPTADEGPRVAFWLETHPPSSRGFHVTPIPLDSFP